MTFPSARFLLNGLLPHTYLFNMLIKKTNKNFFSFVFFLSPYLFFLQRMGVYNSKPNIGLNKIRKNREATFAVRLSIYIHWQIYILMFEVNVCLHVSLCLCLNILKVNKCWVFFIFFFVLYLISIFQKITQMSRVEIQQGVVFFFLFLFSIPNWWYLFI